MIDPGLFKLAVEQTKDYALFILDPEGRVMTWNQGAELIKRYAAEEIIGRHFSVFYTRDAIDSGWPAYELKVATSEGRFEDEGWRVRKDGSRFWANVIITALRDKNGRLIGFSKVTRDLTERKLHEEALRHSEERFRLLVEGVVDYAIYMLDPEGIVTSWNAGAQRIKGYAREEILGKHFSLFYPQDEVDAGAPWEELAVARRVGRAEADGWRIRKDGERFWAHVVVTPLYDPSGRLRGFAKVTQDLSERRHVQELENAAKNVNEFIAMLAHELRNPLAPIRNAVQVMAKAPPGDALHEMMRETIDRQSGQLARIVDDLLDIARITRGDLAIAREPIDLTDVVLSAVETVTPAIEVGKHALEVDLPTETVRIHADAHRLTQLLANVINNAARYTPPGGTVSVRARREGAHAVTRVRDTGRGIEPGMIERIFDMFVQGRSPLQRAGSGLGLGIGLALARKIAELHGGSLEAVSEGEGKGSEFTLRLPLLAARRAGAEPHVHAPEKTVTPRRVLVVDDNVDAATTLHLLVRSLGHETCVVYDGAQALKMARDFRPDVVLLDIGMPGIDGYEVARQLRALKTGAPLRIVAVTGWGQEPERQRAREAGFDEHLVKPVDQKQLTQALGEKDGETLH